MGMKQKEGIYIKPLLSTEKTEILNYLIQNNITFAIDSSNEKTIYDRNKIRHNISPILEEINTSYKDNIARLSNHAISYESYIHDIFYEPYTKKQFNVSWYNQLHAHLQKEWIHYLYKQKNNGTIGSSTANISEIHRYITTAR